MKFLFFTLLLLTNFSVGFAQTDEQIIRKIYDEQLNYSPVYENLRCLSKEIGCRISGSEQLSEAIEYTQRLMKQYMFDTVFLQPVMVSNWQRGKNEILRIIKDSNTIKRNLNCIALGNSIGTGEKGISGKVIEINGLKELESSDLALIEGRIVFLNQPMDKSHINTFDAYSAISSQREKGASKASAKGAIAVIVRSLCIGDDDTPHTGYMGYDEGVRKIPAVAISTNDANYLSSQLREKPNLEIYLETHCRSGEEVMSYNVIGELIGKDCKDEIIVVGGHIDSWDVGEGAHDDGAGCLQAVEVLRTFKALQIQPNHTLRVVLWVDEENSWSGNITYKEKSKQSRQKHIAAIEADAGSFTPLGFYIDCDNQKIYDKVISWKPFFEPYQLSMFQKGHAGTDIVQLKDEKILLLGLMTDSQRYHMLHHTNKDVFEAVDKRELELGAAAMTSMVYLIDKYGLD